MKAYTAQLRWLSFLTAILCILACHDGDSGKDVMTIAINPHNAGSYAIEEISDTVKYIQLETCDHCYIGYIDQMIVYREKIFILDAKVTERILVFDIHGKHLYNINDSKNDPLLRVMNLASISIHKDELYVVDRNSLKVFVYNMEGEFIKIHHLPIIIQALVVSDDVIIGRNTDQYHHDFPFDYIVFDKNFQPIKGFRQNGNPNVLAGLGRTDLLKNQNRNDILIHEALNDTLYIYSGSSFRPFIHLDYGEYSLTMDERWNEQVYNFIVRKNSRIYSPVFITYSGDHISYRYWWNKGDGYRDAHTQYAMIHVENGHLFHISEFTCKSLTEYVDFFPQYRIRSTFYLAQPVYGFAQNTGIKSSDYGIYTDVNELKKNVSINDNPVLIVFTVKEHLIGGMVQ